MSKFKARTSIPTLSIGDVRLTPVDHQVLAALCFFENHRTHVADPTRDDISNFLNIHDASVSRATKRLDDFGWIIKEGRGKGIKYHINWVNNPNEDDSQPLPDGYGSDNSNGNEMVTVVKTQPLPDGYGSESSNINNGNEMATVEPEQQEQPLPDGYGSNIDNSNNANRNDPVVSVGKNQGTTISSNINNPNNNKYSDQISDSDEQICFQVAVEILQAHGCPHHFNPTHDNINTDIIQSWVDAKYPVKLIKQAAHNAEMSPTRTGPLGTKYVNGCIQSLIHKPKERPGSNLRVPADNDEMVKWAKEKLDMTASPHDSYTDFRSKVYAAVEKIRNAA